MLTAQDIMTRSVITVREDATVRELASNGVKRIDVACPGFAVDCLETLEEIAMQNRDFFIAAGGESLADGDR